MQDDKGLGHRHPYAVCLFLACISSHQHVCRELRTPLQMQSPTHRISLLQKFSHQVHQEPHTPQGACVRQEVRQDTQCTSKTLASHTYIRYLKFCSSQKIDSFWVPLFMYFVSAKWRGPASSAIYRYCAMHKIAGQLPNSIPGHSFPHLKKGVKKKRPEIPEGGRIQSTFIREGFWHWSPPVSAEYSHSSPSFMWVKVDRSI